MKRRKNKIKASADIVAFNIISYVAIAVFAFACFLPFYLILVGSFTDEKVVLSQGYRLFLNKESFGLAGYEFVFKVPEMIFRAYGVTALVTVTGTVLSLLITTMAGYVLSRPTFPWRNGFSFYFFFTTLFSGGLVPLYLLCTQVLKFNNRLHALIVPLLFSVWNMIITKSFMKGLPYELAESAKVDGAREWTIYWKVMLPLSKPLLATLALFTALAYWNDWYNCMLFISDKNLYNLQYTLQNLLSSVKQINEIANRSGIMPQKLPSETMKMAMTIVTIGPIILLYPFLQKYFVRGLTIGAVKG